MVIAIHGGAGTILKSEMSAEKESAYKHALQTSLNKGFSILAKKYFLQIFVFFCLIMTIWLGARTVGIN